MGIKKNDCGQNQLGKGAIKIKIISLPISKNTIKIEDQNNAHQELRTFSQQAIHDQPRRRNTVHQVQGGTIPPQRNIGTNSFPHPLSSENHFVL